jgi:hypothetical protein
MGNLNGCRVVLLMTPPVFMLLPVSIITFALERYSRALLSEQTRRVWSESDTSIVTVHGPTSTGSNNLTDIDISLRTDQAPTISILCICCLAFLVSVIGACGIWEMRRVGGTPRPQRAWTWGMLISYLVMMGASAGILGYTTSVQSSEKGWQRYEDVGKAGQEFTRETWACQIENFFPGEGWAGAACGTAKAARLLLIPMIVASALGLVSLSFLVRYRGGISWLKGGKGRYGGFDVAYELQPTGPVPPYAFQAAPQWGPQPIQQWAPPPGQQWAPAPGQQWAPAPGQQWIPQPQQQAPQHGTPQHQAPQQPIGPTQASDAKEGQQVVFR